MERRGEGEVRKGKTSVAGGVGGRVGSQAQEVGTHTPNHADAERAKCERVGGNETRG